MLKIKKKIENFIRNKYRYRFKSIIFSNKRY